MNSIDSVVIYKIVIHSHVHYTHCNLGKVNLRVYMMYEIMMNVHCTYCSVCVHKLFYKIVLQLLPIHYA